jgi:hypothetical protein
VVNFEDFFETFVFDEAKAKQLVSTCHKESQKKIVLKFGIGLDLSLRLVTGCMIYLNLA